MQNMFKKMDSLYSDLADYYVFDKQKYTLEEFFTDLKKFKDDFIVSCCCFLLNVDHLNIKLMTLTVTFYVASKERQRKGT